MALICSQRHIEGHKPRLRRPNKRLILRSAIPVVPYDMPQVVQSLAKRGRESKGRTLWGLDDRHFVLRLPLRTAGGEQDHSRHCLTEPDL